MRRSLRMKSIVVAMLLLAIMASQSILGGSEQSSSINGKFLMAVHGCDTGASHGCRGPQYNDVYLVQSADGWKWSLIPGIEPFEGDVPDLIRRGDSLYVYYLTFGFLTPPETLHVRRYNIHSGVLEAERVVSVTHNNGAKESIVDPSLVVDDDGKLAMFYLVQDVGMNDPAVCPPGSSRCTKVFRSATEVEGSDGTEFIVDAGNRYEREIGAHEILADPDVFKGPNGYVMYVGYVDESYRSGPPDVTLALSSTALRGGYTLVSALRDGVLARSISGGPAGVYDFATEQYWTYGTQVTRDESLIIAGATHGSLNSLIRESLISPAVTGEGLAGLDRNFILASPGLALNLP